MDGLLVLGRANRRHQRRDRLRSLLLGFAIDLRHGLHEGGRSVRHEGVDVHRVPPEAREAAESGDAMTETVSVLDRQGPSCGHELRLGAMFCGACGADLSPTLRASVTETPPSTRSGRPIRAWSIRLGIVLIGAASVGLAGAYYDVRQQLTSEQTAREASINSVDGRVDATERRLAAIDAHVAQLDRRFTTQIRKNSAGIAPLANRLLQSVFTIETEFGSGSGWAAWTAAGSTYIVTANHVVDGVTDVTVKRKTSTWNGSVVKTDSVNDLALIRVRQRIAKPLWPRPTVESP